MKLAGKLTIALGLAATAALAQSTPPATSSMSKSLGLMAFPAKGQTAQQQQKDEFDCYTWAKGQTNYDPVAPPPPQQAAAPAPAPPQGGAGRGAARGAAAGAAVGAVAGDAGTGAAVGATAGAIKGHRDKKRSQAQAQQDAQAQQQQASQAQLDQYKKAFSACLEGKGYSIK